MATGRQGGFTYITALFLIAVLGAGLATIGQVWSTSRQREKEQELLWVGNQFKEAIGLYYQRSPGTIKRYPEKLEDLLEDRRQVSLQRYLRRIYRDPMTGAANWAVILGPDGRVIGIHSISSKSVLQRTVIRGVDRYSDWRFIYEPPLIVHR